MFSRIGSSLMSPKASLWMLCLMLVVPFIFPHHKQPITSFFAEWLTAVFAVLAATPMLFTRGWQPYSLPQIIWLPMALIVVVVAQLLLIDIAYVQHQALVVHYLILVCVMMALGSMLRQQLGLPFVVRYLAFAFLAIGIISAVLVGFQLANISFGGWVMANKSGGAISNIGQQNHLANLSAIALCSLIYLHVNRHIHFSISLVFGLMLIAILFLTSARSAWLYIGMLPVFTLMFRHWQKINGWPSGDASKRLLTITLTLPIIFLLLHWLIPALLPERELITPGGRLIENAQQGSIRLQLFMAGWHVFMTNPLLGVGFGQLAGHDLQLAHLVPELTGNVAHAHNLFIQLLAETGLIGCLVVLVALVRWVWGNRLAAINLEYWWLVIVLGVLFTHSMLEYPLWYAFFLAPAALLLGLGDHQTHTIKSRFAPLVLAAILIVSIASLYLTVRHNFKLEGWFNEPTLSELSGPDFDNMFEDLKPIRSYSPLAVYGDTTLLYALPINRDDVEIKREAIGRILKGLPSAGHAYQYTTLLFMEGRQEEASAHLRNVYLRHPWLINHYWAETVRIALKGDYALQPLILEIQAVRDADDDKTEDESEQSVLDDALDSKLTID